MEHFINYIKDTMAELKHVSWPTNKQSVVYTALVVGLSAVIALYIALFDNVFAKALKWFLG